MNYSETLEYLFHALPAYHRVGAAAYKADLVNTEVMMDYLDHPERGFRSIHVAGTNGKGSVSHFLASILQEAGYKVGLYTSPHLVDFRERIRINGNMIPQPAVVDFVARHKAFFERQQLSFFEMTVGLAFDYFRNEKVDIAVIEVGMGGRLDSTNVITPLLSVITNIGLDHTQFLGDTIEKIAVEKAGIIKPGVPVVIGQTQEETEPVFRCVAQERGSAISFADRHWKVELRECGEIAIGDEAFRWGLDHVVDNTHLMGRWQIIGHNPLTICETAHNYDGINAMMMGLERLEYHRLHIIYGCVGDKDYNKILAYLNSQLGAMKKPGEVEWRFSQPSVERALPVAELQKAANAMGIEGPAFKDVNMALADARSQAAPDDLILVTGSIFLIADVLNK